MLWSLEKKHWQKNLRLVAGIDEAGRGAWAGPVAVAAVILPPDGKPRPYRDSKILSAKQRQTLTVKIKNEALAWTVELVTASQVDEMGVLNATKHAALICIQKLEPAANALITDYLKLDTSLPIFSPAKADSLSYSVAAASILAKTARDGQMQHLEVLHPGYGFGKHKGYGTAMHLAALKSLGVCLEHRQSFKPIQEIKKIRILT